MIIISLACGEIGDLEIVWWTLSIWKQDSGGVRGRAAPDIQPDQSGLNRATDISVEGLQIQNIWFTLWLDIDG